MYLMGLNPAYTAIVYSQNSQDVNAAINAARNVLAEGQAVLACGEAVRPGRAKAPTGKSPRSRKPHS